MFDDIPDEVFKLFDEIINNGHPVQLLAPQERAYAYGIAWGWNPPLLKLGCNQQLTPHGLAAYAWRKLQKPATRTGQRSKDYSDDPFLPAETPTQAAKRMKRHITTVKRYIKDRKLRCEIVGRRLWRLNREDVIKLGGNLD